MLHNRHATVERAVDLLITRCLRCVRGGLSVSGRAVWPNNSVIGRGTPSASGDSIGDNVEAR